MWVSVVGALMKKQKLNVTKSLPVIQAKYQQIDEVGKELNSSIEVSTVQLKSLLNDINLSKEDLVEFCLIIWHKYQHTKKELEKTILKNSVSIQSISDIDKKREITAQAKVTGRIEAFEPNKMQAKQIIQDIETENRRKIIQTDWRVFKLRMEKTTPNFIPDNRRESASKDHKETIGFALPSIKNYWTELTGFPARQK
jgi:hypothetical protein